MPDIFDQLDTPPAKSGGDVFDQLPTRDIFDELPEVSVSIPAKDDSLLDQFKGVGQSFSRGVTSGLRALDVAGEMTDKRVPTIRQGRKAFEQAMQDPRYNAQLAEASRLELEDPAAGKARAGKAEELFGPSAKLEQMRRRVVTEQEARRFDIAQAGEKLATAPQSQAMDRWAKADNSNWWQVFASDPVEITANIVAESLPQSAVGMAAGAALGSRLGPAGTAVGVGVGSFATEYANSVLASAQESGFDMTKPEAVKAFFASPQAQEEAKAKAIARGVPIGVLDAVSAGLAGKFLGPTLGKGVRQVASGTAKEIGMQMGTGAGGEALAQVASGEPLSLKEIAAEAIGELGSAPAEAVSNIKAERARGRMAMPEGGQVNQPAKRDVFDEVAAAVPKTGTEATADARPQTPATAPALDLADLQAALRGNQLAPKSENRGEKIEDRPDSAALPSDRSPLPSPPPSAIRLRAIVPEGQPAAEMTIEPLTEALFNTHLKRRNPLITTLDEYQEAYPQDTHLKTVRKADGTVTGAKAGGLKELLPKGVGTDWQEIGQEERGKKVEDSGEKLEPRPQAEAAASLPSPLSPLPSPASPNAPQAPTPASPAPAPAPLPQVAVSPRAAKPLAGESAPAVAPPSRKQVLDGVVRAALSEVEKLKRTGEVPAAANTFADLQDYLDANMLVNRPEIGALGKSLGWKTPDYVQFTNEAIALLDKKLTPPTAAQPDEITEALTGPTPAPIVAAAGPGTISSGTALTGIQAEEKASTSLKPTTEQAGAVESGESPDRSPATPFPAGRQSLGAAASKVTNGKHKRSTTTDEDGLLYALASRGFKLPFFRPDNFTRKSYQNLQGKALRNEPMTQKEKDSLARFRTIFPRNYEDNYGPDGEIMEQAYQAAQRAGLATELFREQTGRAGGEWDTSLDAFTDATGKTFTLREIFEAIPTLAEAHLARKGGAAQTAEAKHYEQQAKADAAFKRAQSRPGNGTELIPPDDIRTGSSYTLDGHKLRVVDMEFDDEGRVTSVTLEDGKAYQTQRLVAEDGSEVPALRADEGSLKDGRAEPPDPKLDGPEDDVVFSKVDVNRELNRLLAKEGRTPTENARVTELQNQLGQQDLFAVETRDPKAIEREQQDRANREELERRRTAKLRGNAIETTDNLFGERKEDKSGNGLFFSKAPSARPQTPSALSVADVEQHLAEAHGAQPGGVVQVVDEPDAGFDGRAVFDRETGELLRIEVNAAQVGSTADVDRVLAHEVAHVVWRDGGVGELLGTLKEEERAEIARDMRELGYEAALQAEEGGARGIEALVNAWRGRSWFGQVVGRVLAWASEHGLKLSRRAAEFIAARAVAKTQADVIAADQFEQLTKLPGAVQAQAGGRLAVLVPPGERLAAYKITAHHGTPHTVDKFSTSKIGTGEGAQVYGWGLYFAENEQVAEDYAKNVKDGAKVDSINQQLGDLSREMDSISRGYREWNKGYEEQGRKLAAEYDRLMEEKQRPGQRYTVTLNVEPEDLLDWDKPLSEQSEKVRKALKKEAAQRRKKMGLRLVTKENDGWNAIPSKPFPDLRYYTNVIAKSGRQFASLYGATPEEAEAKARDVMDKLGAPDDAMTGREWYQGMAANSEVRGARDIRHQADVSYLLSDLGLKGIRYLDQGSRGRRVEFKIVAPDGFVDQTVAASREAAEEVLAERSRGQRGWRIEEDRGTYNYVIFNEEDITITHANGQPVSAAEASGQRPAPEVRESRVRPVKVPAGPLTETEGFKRWFRDSKVVDAEGKPKRVYHGTKRPDRVGSRFRADRATSGPMSFFTDDPEIGSKYATGKQDTSLEHPDDYSGWFKFKPEGSRSSVPIDRAWWFLTPDQRTMLADTLPRVSNITEDGDSMEDGQLRLTPPGETGLMPADSWAYELRQAKGNSLKAAVEAWLNSGALFNREEEFLDVLRTAGLTGVEFDSPWAEYPSVYPVYLSIQNPLVTSAIPSEVLDALHANGKRKRARPYGADQWDKNTVSGPDWLERLDGDQQNGTTHAWTSIPDWVTQTLRDFGYDGIHDTGGKRGGPSHTVWIPFDENQVKSATGNRGTFDPEKVDIRESRVKRSSGPVESLKERRDDAAARGFSYAAQVEKLKSDGKTVPKSLTEAIAKQAAELKEATFQLLRHPDYVADQVRAVDAKLTELQRLKDRQRILKAQGQDLESDERARLGELEHWEPESFVEDTVLFQTAEEFIGIPPTLIAEAIERTPGLKHFITEREKEQVQAILDNPNLTPSQRQKMLDDLEKNRGRALAPLPMPSDLPPRGNVALATSTTLAGNADPSTFWQSFKKWLRNFATPTPEIPVLGPQARWNAPMRGFLNAVRSGTITAQQDAKVMVEKVLQPLLDLPRKQLDPTALDKHKTLARKLQFAEKQFEAQAEAMRAEIDSMEQAQADRAAIRERREALAEFEGNPPAKIAELQRRLTEAEAALAENPMHLFKLAVLYNDYESRFQMLQPKQKGQFKFPGGLTIEDIVNEHARVNAAIEKSSAQAAIKEAMDQHYRMMADLEQRLLDHGLLIPEDMKNGAYFPHQVLDYTSQHLSRLRPTTEERFRGYLVDPVGSKRAIETDYLQAVYRHAAEVLADNAHLDAVEEWIQPLDISQRIKDNVEAMAAASGRTAGKMEWRSPDNLPPGYRFFDATKKLPLRPGYVLDADTIAKALDVSLKDGDVVEQMQKLGVDFTVTADMLKAALVSGDKAPWVLPVEIADALDGILEREKAEDARSKQAFTKALRKAVGLWKLDTLFAPWHYVRYEWGNTLSDVVDKVMGADPGMARHLPRAFREVIAFVDNDEATPELRAAFEHLVLDTVTFAEVGKVADSPAFEQLRSDTQRALAMAGNFVKGATMPAIPIVRLLSGAKVKSTIDLSRLREASFRYAKFLADLERIKAGQNPVYAGAYWKDVEQERTPEAKAAFISRRTFGDYGDMSVFGDRARKDLIPFYSWTEVNFRYHTNLLKNFADMIRKGEFGSAAQSARAVATYTALRLALPYVAVHLWNTVGGAMAGAWDDDDDLEATLSDADRRRFHLILGKDDRGQTRVMYAPTAFSDVVSWFGGDNLARLLAEYARGDMTFERLAGDYAKQLVPDVLNKVAQSAGPIGKGAFIAASGKQPFPDVTNMRSVSGREKLFAVLTTMTDRDGVDLLRRAFDNDYYPRPAGEVMKQLILQIRRRDPEQWAFYQLKEKVSAWKYDKTGKRYEAGDYTAPEAQALRSFRRAVYLGDVDAAQRFYTRLLGFGYTAERLRASIQHQAPLAELNEKERPEFIRSLTRAERQQLVRAVQYWERLGVLKGKESGLFPKKGVKTFTPQPDRLRGVVENFDRKPDDEVKRTAERLVERALAGR